jgi:hypothetical protein
MKDSLLPVIVKVNEMSEKSIKTSQLATWHAILYYLGLLIQQFFSQAASQDTKHLNRQI